MEDIGQAGIHRHRRGITSITVRSMPLRDPFEQGPISVLHAFESQKLILTSNPAACAASILDTLC
jgi:hypothetical protein